MAEDEGSLRLTVRSAPFLDDPPEAPQFYEAIGRAIVLWGRAEQGLDWLLKSALNVAARRGIQGRMRIALASKIALLRKLYRECEPLREDADNLDAFLDKMQELSDDRNLLVHSHISGFFDDPPRLRIQKAEFKDGKIIFRKAQPSLSELQNLIAEIDSLILYLLHFQVRISAHDEAVKTTRTKR